MTKIIKSQSAIYPGSVHLADPMTMPMVRAVDEALEATAADELNKLVSGKNADGEPTIKTYLVDERMIPAILACVEKWELQGFPEVVTADTFPATPRRESHELVKWIFAEIHKIYIGELTIPNG